MNADVHNLFQNAALDINLRDNEPTMFPVSAKLARVSHSFQGNLHMPLETPQKRSIQTQAQKGACRISQKLKEKMLQGINGVSTVPTTLQIPTLNILKNELSSTRDEEVVESLIQTKENEVFSTTQQNPLFTSTKTNRNTNATIMSYYSNSPRGSIFLAQKKEPPIQSFISPEDGSFLERIQEYKDISAKLQPLEEDSARPEFVNKSVSKKRLNSLAINQNQSLSPKNRSKSKEKKPKPKPIETRSINPGRVIRKPPLDQGRERVNRSYVARADLTEEISQPKNWSSNKKKRDSSEEKAESSLYSSSFKEPKERSNSNSVYSSIKETPSEKGNRGNRSIIGRRLPLEDILEKPQNKPMPQKNKDVLAIINDMFAPKRPDPKELREKYTRVSGNRPKPRSSKKGEASDIFTLGEIQRKKPREQQNESLYMVAKSNLFDFNDQSQNNYGYPNQNKSFDVGQKHADKSFSRNMGDKAAHHDSSFDYPEAKIPRLLRKLINVTTNEEFESNIDLLVFELKKEHSFLQKLSYRILKEILRCGHIVTIKNQNLYMENDYNEYAYIVLYGKLYLKTKSLGVFADCPTGNTIGEEAILENSFVKQETAQVLEETTLIELSPGFLDDLRMNSVEEDFFGLITALKKNMIQKRSLRTAHIFS